MKRLLLVPLLLFCTTFAAAQDVKTPRQQAVDKAVTFLRTTQAESGVFSPEKGVGPTALILSGLLDVGVKPDDPMVAKGLKFLESVTREDGGVYTLDGFFQNYETCIAVLCFSTANRIVKETSKSDKGPYDDLLAKAQKYLLGE